MRFRPQFERNKGTRLPVGIKFRVRQKTAGKAVLKSNFETYYADYSYAHELFTIELTRSNCREAILFEAELVASAELAEIV